MNHRNTDKKRRIAQLLPGLRTGGCERIVLNLHQTIDRSLFDNTILYWQDNPEMLDNPFYRDERPFTCRLSMPKPISLASLRTLCNHLKKEKINLLHTHLIDANLLGFLAAKIVGIPHIVTIHSYPFPAKRLHCLRYKIMTMLSTRIVCVSNVVTRHVLSVTGIRPDRVFTIHSGAHLSRYSAMLSDGDRHALCEEFRIPPGAFIVGCISRLAPDKGHDDLLDAVPLVLRECKDAYFLIVGDGDLRNRFEEKATALGIGNRVFFTGMRSNIPQINELSDICISGSLHEAFGLIVLEYMASGKPIIGVNSSVITELLTHGESGIIIPPNSPSAIAEAILDLYRNPAKRKSLARNAALRAQSFSIEQTARSMETLYLSLLDK